MAERGTLVEGGCVEGVLAGGIGLVADGTVGLGVRAEPANATYYRSAADGGIPAGVGFGLGLGLAPTIEAPPMEVHLCGWARVRNRVRVKGYGGRVG